jgi:hypothetical protein
VKNLIRIHLDMRPEPGEVSIPRGIDGRASDWEAYVFGVYVRLVGWVRFVWMAATGRTIGVAILRGDDGARKAPRVLMDWETYSKLMLLAAPQRIPDMTECSGEEIEMGGSFR